MKGRRYGKYFGYFENQHREQWVFIYDRATKTAELRGGDIEWNNVQRVENGQVAGLSLGQEESVWLQTCWKAATAFKK